MRVPGVDADRFAEAVQSQGILGYIDTLSGGSISRVGIFSLGTAPIKLQRNSTRDHQSFHRAILPEKTDRLKEAEPVAHLPSFHLAGYCAAVL